jgi:hypothetical protein
MAAIAEMTTEQTGFGLPILHHFAFHTLRWKQSCVTPAWRYENL